MPILYAQFYESKAERNWAFNVAGNNAISLSDVIDFARSETFGLNCFKLLIDVI